jgi:UDP-glucose 4-epimerase
MTRHVLVTGGAGFIGSHLVERLLGDGKKVVVIDDCSTGTLSNLEAVRGHRRLRIIRGKVSSCAELSRLVAGAESIYHLAAAVGVELVMQSPVRAIETNLRETEAILRSAGAHPVPVLLVSSSEVYGKSRQPAFSEEDDLVIGAPRFSRWSYACSKLMNEFLALAYARERGLPVVIARVFNTVGPRQTGRYGMVLPRFIAAARANKPLQVFGGGQQRRSFCYVTDAVEALIRLQNAPAARGEVFNVGGTEEITIRALAETVIAVLRSKSRIDHLPYDQAYPPGFEDMRRRCPVIKKLVAVTGFCPATSLREIIKLTAAALAR